MCLCGAPGGPRARPAWNGISPDAPGLAAGVVPPAAARPSYSVFGDVPVPGQAPVCIDPREGGYRTIAALQDAGRFDAAARFALAGGPALRRDFVNAAFLAWGRKAPETALEAALTVPEPAEREVALNSVFSGWACTDPRALAELALRFPEGDEKTAALTKALRRWMHGDPWAAGDWILAHADAVPVAEAMFRVDER